MAWKAVLSSVSSPKLICLPQRPYHIRNPSDIHSDVLLRFNSNLQWFPHAWILNCIHFSSGFLFGIWWRCRRHVNSQFSTSLQDIVKRTKHEYQDFLYLALEIYIPGNLYPYAGALYVQGFICQYRNDNLHRPNPDRNFKRLHTGKFNPLSINAY